MNPFLQIARALALGTCAFAVLALGNDSETKKTKNKIYQVDNVKLTVSGAAKIKITATGMVRTGGWTEPQLVPQTNASTPTSGPDITLHFNFVATKPTGIVTQVLTPITAEASCPAPSAGKTLKVIVHGETNTKEDSIKSPMDER